MSTDEVISRTRLLENEIKVILNKAHLRGSDWSFGKHFILQIMKSEISRISHEQQGMKEKIKVRLVQILLIIFYMCYL